jgi:hypothetical protein
MNVPELLADFSELEEEDLRACLVFAAVHANQYLYEPFLQAFDPEPHAPPRPSRGRDPLRSGRATEPEFVGPGEARGAERESDWNLAVAGENVFRIKGLE